MEGVKKREKVASTETEGDLLSDLLQKQVFLGMVASSILPRQEIPGLVEDLTAAGVRFVYFSPRNMRRSKTFAEKIGIETDWNCAISLRTTSGPDAFRMYSTEYGDWDVKARLPHGVEAIRNHLEHVDNVPLLVSLFTDSMPSTVDSMFEIMQEYHHSVLCVGCAFRSTNMQLFRTSDLAISVDILPGTVHTSLPKHAPNRLSALDTTLNADLISLHCALKIGAKAHTCSMSLLVMMDLLREGRRCLQNIYQMLAMTACVLYTTALFLALGVIVPILLDPLFDTFTVLWILWVVLPLLILPMMNTPGDPQILSRTPRKNVVRAVETRRLLGHLTLRCIPTVIGCLFIYLRAFATALMASDAVRKECGNLDKADSLALNLFNHLGWEILHCPYLSDRSTLGSFLPQVDFARDVTLAALVLTFCIQSSGLLHRTHSIFTILPFYNRVWIISTFSLLALQTLYVVLRAVARDQLFVFVRVPLDLCLIILLLPVAVLAIGELVKLQDKEVHDRHMRYLRAEFNTRLGTHSPR